MKRTDAILDMIYLCIIYILQRYDEETQLRILAKVSWFLRYCNAYSSSVCENLDLDTEQIEAILEEIKDPEKRDEALEKLIGESIYPVMDKAKKMTMGLAAHMATTMVANGVLAYAAAKYIAGSLSLGMSVRTSLYRYAGMTAGFLSNYGYVTKAAATAERLRLINPRLYSLLYMNNLEMFFFLFDGYLPNDIYLGDYAFTTEDEAIRFFKRLIQ
ncbi:TPA: hypothetical protein JGU28_004360 [Salmonella enterica]|nr:hypothetical protein [Salmonella enterica]